MLLFLFSELLFYRKWFKQFDSSGLGSRCPILIPFSWLMKKKKVYLLKWSHNDIFKLLNPVQMN